MKKLRRLCTGTRTHAHVRRARALVRASKTSVPWREERESERERGAVIALEAPLGISAVRASFFHSFHREKLLAFAVDDLHFKLPEL